LSGKKIGAIIVIVRFHNLAARAPSMADLDQVTELMIACDVVESRIAEPTAEDVRQAWQRADFCLSMDAWVIVTGQGKLVGYADVRCEERGHLVSMIRVHPEYRRRGIGTLLIWLTEERARQLMRDQEKEQRVVLSLTVSGMDQGASCLLEREGYTLARHFWRLVIDVDEVARTAQEELEEQRKLKLDLVIDSHTLLGDAATFHRTGMYVAHQYNVYEKVLRMGERQTEEVAVEQCVSA
jgi:GNAT superfamily N-acetyltransferase